MNKKGYFLILRLLRWGKRYCKEIYYNYKNQREIKNEVWQPRILSIEETLNLIQGKKLSVARYGDGEFKWMLGIRQKSFQQDNARLRKLLKQTFEEQNEKILVCLPDIFGNLSKYNRFARNYWSHEMCQYRPLIYSLMENKTRVWGNANVSRFYMDYLDKSHVNKIIEKWKSVFAYRRIYIVEGEFSRLGVGNNLFDQALSVERILAPAKNAFSSYDKILDFVKSTVPLNKDSLILLALGPTATVLVPVLAKYGYQALDIGHIDVEYEWYKLHAMKKVPLVGRYVNEAGGFITEFPEEVLEKYHKEIIMKIDC